MTPLVEAGMLYFGVPPLYRLTASGKKPIYLKSNQELDDFFFDEVKKVYTFSVDGIATKKESSHKKVFHKLMDYTRDLESFASSIRMKPEIVETALFENFDMDSFKFSFDKKVKVEFNEKDNKISIVGFHSDANRESFLAIVNEDADVFFERLTTIYEKHYVPLMESIGILRSDGKAIPDSMCLYEKIDSVTSLLKKTWQVLRFKG